MPDEDSTEDMIILAQGGPLMVFEEPRDVRASPGLIGKEIESENRAMISCWTCLYQIFRSVLPAYDGQIVMVLQKLHFNGPHKYCMEAMAVEKSEDFLSRVVHNGAKERLHILMRIYCRLHFTAELQTSMITDGSEHPVTYL